MGVMVDGVSAVLDIPDCDIEPAPTFAARIRADFIAAMGKLGGRFVVILAIERVLSVDEMALLARISHDTQETTQAT
ncbi:chemotaxis protein CheW [Yanghanlia caeni]|uniref:Chemotaxis protein CheW n=1 Tax=Yanghanlia caeni TaxID=3064283 RepID=A0ABU1D5T1_9BURK|nr:chemotaxis protein CheW [Alcaligenaceae bacterium LG-2]